jgi:CHAT domain-containing protein
MRRIWLGLVSLLLISSAASRDTFSQTPQASPAMSRASFERLLLERARYDNLRTDTGEAYANVYRLLIPARFLDRSLYERALAQLGAEQTREADEDADKCGKTRDEHLTCIARHAATAAAATGDYAESLIFGGDALEFAERLADRKPELAADAAIALARAEWLHGSLTRAEIALKRAAEITATKAALLTPSRKALLALMRARFADADLRDADTLTSLSELADARGAIKEPLEFQIDETEVNALVDTHLTGRLCPDCGKPVAAPILRLLQAQADKLLVDRNPTMSELALLLVRTSGLDTSVMGNNRLQRLAQHYLKSELSSNKRPRDFRSRLAGKPDDLAAARILAASSLLTSEDNPHPDWLAHFRGTAKNDTAVMRELKNMTTYTYDQFGSATAQYVHLDLAARAFERSGFNDSARVALEYLVNVARTDSEGRANGRPLVNVETISLARLFVPALTRLAALKLRNGQIDQVSKLLQDASDIATAKMKDAAQQGGRAKILALRDLAPALHAIAQHTAEVVAKDARGELTEPAGAVRLFDAMQTALQSELSVTLEAANRRRATSDPAIEALLLAYAGGTALENRLAGLPKNFARVSVSGDTFANLDVDGTLTRAHEEVRRRTDDTLAQLSQLAPTLAALTDAETLPIQDALSLLDGDSAIVLLRAGDAGIQGMLVGHRAIVTWKSAATRTQIERLVASVRAGGDMLSETPPDFPLDDAARLYQAIFGPVVKDLAQISKLLILGDGPLQSLPYSALVTAPTAKPKLTAQDDARAAKIPWLIRTHAITLLPSIHVPPANKAAARRTTAEAPGLPSGLPFLGIGNPVLAPVQIAQRALTVGDIFASPSSGLANVDFLRKVSSLPETEDELRQIGKSLGATDDAIVVGNNANEAAVRAMDLSRYQIIAFATHGALAGEVKGSSEPGLILTPPQVASAANDGFLALSEIARLKLNADLVILSACNTGTRDDRPRAESLSGLARAFFGAGARNLFVTHWAIPSQSAVMITTRTIEAKLADPRRDWSDALRDSSLALMDREGPVEWAHPSFWAGYASIGAAAR